MENKNVRVKSNVTLIVGSIIIISLFLISTSLYAQNKSLEEDSLLFKNILYTTLQISEVSIIEQKAESYYSEASFFYENQDYKSVESSCRLAREYYSDASQKYREIKSEFQQIEIEDKLVEIEKEMLKLASEINLNMFEACEHFEVVSRYYNIYYYTDVPYDDSSYDMGNSELEAMNEKIELHDENVRKYNDLLADFTIELKRRL